MPHIIIDILILFESDFLNLGIPCWNFLFVSWSNEKISPLCWGNSKNLPLSTCLNDKLLVEPKEHPIVISSFNPLLYACESWWNGLKSALV